jgi:hypothetical protein
VGGGIITLGQSGGVSPAQVSKTQLDTKFGGRCTEREPISLGSHAVPAEVSDTPCASAGTSLNFPLKHSGAFYAHPEV